MQIVDPTPALLNIVSVGGDQESVFKSLLGDFCAASCLRSIVKTTSSQPHFGTSLSKVGDWLLCKEFRGAAK